tara:strand:- start:516 stop:728 length:213 start_codon:yes stop_codon:yes gene_type:complete
MKNEIAFISNQIASILEIHQEDIIQDDELCDKVHMHRQSLEFFMRQDNEPRALYEAVKCHTTLLDFLDCV